MELIPLPAFQDNYLWLLHHRGHALVVDPGDAGPVHDALQQHDLVLDGILVTHHHADHTGGVAELQQATGAILYGPASETIPGDCHPVRGGEQVQLLGTGWRVIDVPGHTRGHVAYFAEAVAGAPLLFCGDTLFSGGCGRIFEGTPAQMLASLDRLAALPGDTRVCCAHEYTASNAAFAQVVEPGNAALRARADEVRALRAAGASTLPSTIALERATNPFLRCDAAAVRKAAAARLGHAPADRIDTFAALRAWKDGFRA